MCWGTNFYDTDYTNDNDPLASNPRYEYRMKTPTLYLDNSINDTYLRFSSWHQLETKFNQQGDYYYDDCAFVEIEYSTTGQFLGEESLANLPISFPLSSGISPGQGAYFVSDSEGIGNTVTPSCVGVGVNQYALAGTSITPQNPQGWSTVASNLAPYLGYYVKLNFVLYHAGETGNVAPGPSPGWFIDDVTVGERYNQEGIMVINNIQPPNSYDQKSVNGYGVFFADAFEPAESSLEYTFRNSINGVVITGTDGTLMQDLTGPIVELWNIDVDQHPFIDVEIKFDSGPDLISTPSFFGYSLGTEFGITFNDPAPYRNFTINQGIMEFEYDSDPKSNTNVIYYNSTDFMSNADSYSFSKPIYGVGVFDIPALCNSDVKINHAHVTTPLSIPQDTTYTLSEPVFGIDFQIELNSNCDIEGIWFSIVFGEHFENIELDFGADGEYEWELAEPAFGKFGLQDKFYLGEVNGISQSSTDKKFELDPVTGEVIDGFFLIPKGAEIQYLNFEMVSNSIYNRNNTEKAYDLEIIVGTTEKLISFVQNSGDQLFSESVDNISLPVDFLTQFLGDANTPVIKTDDSGIDWVRVGFKVIQLESRRR